MTKTQNTAAAHPTPSKHETRSGPGWFALIASSGLFFAAGWGSATLAIDSAAAIDAYKGRSIQAEAPPPPLELVSFDEPGINSKPQWFPETNRIDWSISLRPGVSTTPVKIDNLAERENHRVLFQVISEDRDPQLAAVLFVRANGRAAIQLPPAEYRLDVVSTPIDMAWSIAKEQYASPRMKLEIEAKRSSIIGQEHLEISDGGTLRPRKSQTIRITKASAHPAPSPSEAADPVPGVNEDATKEPLEVDYGAIEIGSPNSSRPET